VGYTLIDANTEEFFSASITMASAMKKTESLSTAIFIHFGCFHLNTQPDIKQIREILEQVKKTEITAYVFRDYDIILKCDDYDDHEVTEIQHQITNLFQKDIERLDADEQFVKLYTLINDLNILKKIARQKMKQTTKQGRELDKYFSDTSLIKTLRNTINIIEMQRSFRTQPIILIVEDQLFSAKLLEKILSDYTVHCVDSAGEALLKYVEKCPDIVFLDIELPDTSGHSFARLLKSIDARSNTVLVSARSFQSDIETARENNIRKFISKPFQEKEILKCVELWRDKWRKLSHQ
jgi:CheY-like chemotaxis protein